MKYALVIAGGGGEPIGVPIPELDGFSPLEAAQTPTLDALGQTGRQGVAAALIEGVDPGLHAPIGALLGMDTHASAPTRGVLEAVGLSADIADTSAVWRLAPVTMDGDFATIQDAFPALLAPADTRSLCDALRDAMREREALSGFRVVPGAGAHGSEALLILDDAPEEARAGRVRMASADQIRAAGKPLIRALPRGELGHRLREVCELSADVFQGHPVNLLRAEHDLPPVSMFWCEGGGGGDGGRDRGRAGGFGESMGVRAAMITGDAAAAGAAGLLGIDRLPVPGELVGKRADFRAMSVHAVEALDRYDLVIVHCDAWTGASLAGDWRTKAELWTRLDEDLVGPILARLIVEGDAEADAAASGWRMMVACDSVCSCAQRCRTVERAPFVMSGAYIRSVLRAPFGDASAHESDLSIGPGHTLMEYFLYSGLRVSSRRSGTIVARKARES